MSASALAAARRVPSAGRPVACAVLSALGAFVCLPAAAQLEVPVKSLGMVTITGGQPTSLPTQIPTTLEGVTQEDITQKIIATDSQNALKYLPSLLVRKRYIGNYNLYGTSTSTRYSGHQVSASLGHRNGDWSWFINANRTTNEGQPLTFATRALSTAAPATGARVVTGAVPGLDRTGTPWLLLGGATQYTTTQNHLKVKLAYDVSPTVRAAYTLGVWQNDSNHRSQSYLKDAAGAGDQRPGQHQRPGLHAAGQ